MATFLIQTVVCTTNVILYFAVHKDGGVGLEAGGTSATHDVASNQIYLVTFMCLTVDTSFTVTKKAMLPNVILRSLTPR